MNIISWRLSFLHLPQSYKQILSLSLQQMVPARHDQARRVTKSRVGGDAADGGPTARQVKPGQSGAASFTRERPALNP